MNLKNFLKVYLNIILVFIYLPIALVIIYSFDNSRFTASWDGFTLKWYHQLFQDANMINALYTSIIIAIIAVLFSAIFGTLAAYYLARFKNKYNFLFLIIIMLPLLVPEIAIGISSLVLFNFCNISLNYFTIIISHITFCISYICLIVLTRLKDFDTNIEEAAYDLGASNYQVFFKITLPNIYPAIFAGSLLAFILSFDDFVITQFTAGVGVTTIPLKIFSMVKFGVCPEINALATLLILSTSIIAYSANRLINPKKESNLAQ